MVTKVAWGAILPAPGHLYMVNECATVNVGFPRYHAFQLIFYTFQLWHLVSVCTLMQVLYTLLVVQCKSYASVQAEV